MYDTMLCTAWFFVIVLSYLKYNLKGCYSILNPTALLNICHVVQQCTTVFFLNLIIKKKKNNCCFHLTPAYPLEGTSVQNNFVDNPFFYDDNKN